MKKIIFISLLILSYFGAKAQTTPVSPSQMNQVTWYYEPSTTLKWGFNTARGWFFIPDSAKVVQWAGGGGDTVSFTNNFKNLGTPTNALIDIADTIKKTNWVLKAGELTILDSIQKLDGIVHIKGANRSFLRLALGEHFEPNLYATEDHALLVNLALNSAFFDNGHTDVYHAQLKSSGDMIPGLDTLYNLGHIDTSAGRHFEWKNIYSKRLISDYDLHLHSNTAQMYLDGLPDTATAAKVVAIDVNGKLLKVPYSGGSGTVTAVTGTPNRITSTGGTTPQIDISATFEALLGKVANPLSQFASTTSAQLRGVLSDESGTGLAVFGTSPTLTTPVINVGSDATGDIYYRNSSGLFTRLPIGSSTNVLTVTGGVPVWAAPSGGGLAASNFVFNETPSGTINGTNVTFTLANTPTTGKVELYKNGVLLAATTDYTISGSTITYVVPPNTNPYTDILTASYLK